MKVNGKFTMENNQIVSFVLKFGSQNASMSIIYMYVYVSP